jgi:hypothetical protein
VGFPVVLLLIFGLLFLSMVTGIDVNRGPGIVTHLFWSGPAIRAAG